MAVLALGGAGIALWHLLPSESPTPVGPDELPPDPGPRPSTPRAGLPTDRPLAERAPAPREGIFDPAEELPYVPDAFAELRLHIPWGQSRTVGGDRVREALLEVPGLYLRWESAAVKEAFLRSDLRLRPDVAMEATEHRPAGAPIPPALELLPLAGFRARIRPPVITIVRVDGPGADRPGPR